MTIRIWPVVAFFDLTPRLSGKNTTKMGTPLRPFAHFIYIVSVSFPFFFLFGSLSLSLFFCFFVLLLSFPPSLCIFLSSFLFSNLDSAGYHSFVQLYVQTRVAPPVL